MSILIGFICVLLASFLVVVPSPRKTSNLFLAAFLALTAVELTVWLWGERITGITGPSALWFALGKLQMPVFFFFFLSSCYSDFRLQRYDALHLLPFGLSLLATWPGLPDFEPVETLFAMDTPASWLLSQLIYAGYMAVIVVLLWRFRTRFRQHYSGGRSELLIWLSQLAVASLLARVVILFRDTLGSTSAQNIAVGVQIFGALFALAIISWIALLSMLRPGLFRDVDRRVLALSDQNSGTTDADLGRLEAHMARARPFLDPELNLERLADQVAMLPREVSELLNRRAGVHFFDFVNRYRIGHAQALLQEKPERSILQILHECGFQSKSSFNTAFKKHTGMTPSEWRRKTARSTSSRAYEKAQMRSIS